MRQAAEINGIAFTTLRRRFHEGQNRVARHEGQQLITAADERAIVQWIYRLELAGLLPRVEHIREGVMLLRNEVQEDNLDSIIGKHGIT